jgi:hypothetical protein
MQCFAVPLSVLPLEIADLFQYSNHPIVRHATSRIAGRLNACRKHRGSVSGP